MTDKKEKPAESPEGIQAGPPKSESFGGEEIKYESEEDTEGADKKVKKIKEQLKTCEKERAEYLAGWQRAKADYINLQREHEQKIADYFKFANEGLILEILPILDSFDAAIKYDPKSPEAIGLSQIYNQFKSVLKNNGLEQIKALGEKFDPKFHEAVDAIEIQHGTYPELVEGGTIIEEVQKGYKLHGKVIRASKVKINK